MPCSRIQSGISQQGRQQVAITDDPKVLIFGQIVGGVIVALGLEAGVLQNLYPIGPGFDEADDAKVVVLESLSRHGDLRLGISVNKAYGARWPALDSALGF